MWPFSTRTAEHTYVDLMFKATSCYASWDPLRPIRVRKLPLACGHLTDFEPINQVGDYGRLQRDGSFAAKGNIFDDGLAEKYKITKRTDGEDQCRYIVSDNGSSVSVAPDVDMFVMSHHLHSPSQITPTPTDRSRI